MTGRLVVDSDILIDAARKVPDASEYLETRESATRLDISLITEMELVVGCRNKTELRNLGKLLNALQDYTVARQDLSLCHGFPASVSFESWVTDS